MSTIVVVRVTPVASDLHPYDVDVAGLYAFEVAEGVPDRLAANAALDHFHGRVAIKSLDDFEYDVLDRGGNVLEPCPDQDDYSMEGEASLLGRVNSLEEAFGCSPAAPGCL